MQKHNKPEVLLMDVKLESAVYHGSRRHEVPQCARFGCTDIYTVHVA